MESPDLSPLSRSVAGSSASEGEGSVGSGEGSFVVLKTSAKSVKECDSMVNIVSHVNVCDIIL